LMFDSRRGREIVTLGGLFHWLSTNNQLSLLFVVNQRKFRYVAARRPGGRSASRRDEVNWHRFLTRC
jgi:hypothetical protein